MAKAKNPIVKAAEPSLPVVASATAADFGGGLVVKGRDEASLNLSRVVLFQATSEEEAMYGEHKRGTFLDALESRELGETVRIMPVIAFATWAQWEKDAKTPTQTWTDQKDVPPEMLEWTEKDDGTRVPPVAQEAVNVVCAVEGESWPYLIIFKRTGLRAFNKTIAALEARRASIGKCPGLYELGSIKDQNPAGKPYQRLTARPVGDPPAEVVEIAKKVFSAQSHVKNAAVAMAQEKADFDPDAD